MARKDKTWPVAVIGAGAAGLAAAISAGSLLQESGGSVLLLEKLDRVGKKILATGNGRCNLSHEPLDLAAYHGRDPAFCQPALARYDLDSTKKWFEQLGLQLRLDPDGRIFPYSYQATAVLDLLRHALTCLPVNLQAESAVTSLKKTGQGDFSLQCAGGKNYRASQVIVATGGQAAPAFGCSGDGYGLFLDFGHRLIAPVPALVQLLADKQAVRPWTGIRVQAGAALYQHGQLLRQEEGEVLFTEYGLSGPPILQLSRQVATRDLAGLVLQIDFLPKIGLDELQDWLRARCSPAKGLANEHLLTGLVHKKIGQGLLRQLSPAPLTTPAAQNSKGLLVDLAGLLKQWPVKITGTRGWNQAQVTAGGLATADFWPDTLQSKKAAGLFAAGELLDIDGDCGGFNLQWAWSSGRLAGQMSAQAWLMQER